MPLTDLGSYVPTVDVGCVALGRRKRRVGRNSRDRLEAGGRIQPGGPDRRAGCLGSSEHLHLGLGERSRDCRRQPRQSEGNAEAETRSVSRDGAGAHPQVEVRRRHSDFAELSSG